MFLMGGEDVDIHKKENHLVLNHDTHLTPITLHNVSHLNSIVVRCATGTLKAGSLTSRFVRHHKWV